MHKSLTPRRATSAESMAYDSQLAPGSIAYIHFIHGFNVYIVATRTILHVNERSFMFWIHYITALGGVPNRLQQSYQFTLRQAGKLTLIGESCESSGNKPSKVARNMEGIGLRLQDPKPRICEA